MMVMTAKVDLKKLLLLAVLAAGIILGAVLLTGNGDTAPTAAPAVSGNDGRVQFLQGFGWEVASTPKESGEVRIPRQSSPVFERYNLLQQGQGYDLSKYAGKKVLRYVYEVTNYPGATEPVYATVLMSGNQIIGGDVTDTAAKGQIRGFRMPAETVPSESTSLPTETAP